MPNFMVPEGATVWLDNVFYSVGIDSGEFRQERAVTASAKLDRDSGLYRPGETIRSTLRVRNTAETPQTATIRRVMRNFLGEDLPGTVHSEKITLAPHESRELGAELRPTPELRGALNLVYDVEGETTGVYFGILDRPAAPAPRLEFMGVEWRQSGGVAERVPGRYGPDLGRFSRLALSRPALCGDIAQGGNPQSVRGRTSGLAQRYAVESRYAVAEGLCRMVPGTGRTYRSTQRTDRDLRIFE